MNTQLIQDGLVNLVANLGTDRDKQSYTSFQLPLLTDQTLDVVYRSSWLARKIVDVPALDSLRNWRAWQAEPDVVSAIEATEKRVKLRQRLLHAYTQARLFGGCAIYIGVGDSDPTKPLDVSRIAKGGLKHLNVIEKRNLSAGVIDRNADSPTYGTPVNYKLSSGAGTVTIHPSRLVILQGAVKPDIELAGTLDGWGESVLVAIYEAIQQASSTGSNIASLVFEAKVDVLNIPNLMQNLEDNGTEYEAQLLNRLRLAGLAKGINGMLVLDSQETYSQKTTSFGGLRDILTTFLQIVAGAADIPLTRLLGQSPAGMNSTGDSDIRNYYDRIRSNQELVLEPAMEILDACIVRSATGGNDQTIFYNWNSLWQPTEKERSDIGKVTADTLKTLADTGLIPEDVLSTLAVSMLTEAGVAPGLEASMESREQPDESEEALASIQPMNDAAPSPLYVSRKVVNASQIISWAQSQGLVDLEAAEDLHVTVAYSRAPVNWMAAGNDWNSESDGRLRVVAGGPRIVERFGEAVVLRFSHSGLEWRHSAFKDIGASWDHEEYAPHITLSYSEQSVPLPSVVPYNGPIVLGPEIFEALKEV